MVTSVSQGPIYERTTSIQQKEVSDLLSKKVESSEQRKPLKDLANTSTDQDVKEETDSATENSVSDIMKLFSFQQVHGCTFNFSFSSK